MLRAHPFRSILLAIGIVIAAVLISLHSHTGASHHKHTPTDKHTTTATPTATATPQASTPEQSNTDTER